MSVQNRKMRLAAWRRGEIGRDCPACRLSMWFHLFENYKQYNFRNGLSEYTSKQQIRRRLCTVDHIIPSSRGGSNNIKNKVLLCAACNESKGDRLFSEWIHDMPKHRYWPYNMTEGAVINLKRIEKRAIEHQNSTKITEERHAKRS